MSKNAEICSEVFVRGSQKFRGQSASVLVKRKPQSALSAVHVSEFSSALITEPPLSSRHVCTQIQILTFLQQRNSHLLSSRFAVICAQHTAFCFGTSKPRGTLAVMARHLKILGYEPVLVRRRDDPLF